MHIDNKSWVELNRAECRAERQQKVKLLMDGARRSTLLARLSPPPFPWKLNSNDRIHFYLISFFFFFSKQSKPRQKELIEHTSHTHARHTKKTTSSASFQSAIEHSFTALSLFVILHTILSGYFPRKCQRRRKTY